MTRIKPFLITLVLLIFIDCHRKLGDEPFLYLITYKLKTDRTGGPLYLLGFKNFNSTYDFSTINENIVKFEFVNPPQDKLFGVTHYIPKIDSEVTTFEFMDTELIGLDSVEIWEKFLKGIVGNTINIYVNDTILKSIPIEREPKFEYLVGTEKELEERKLH